MKIEQLNLLPYPGELHFIKRTVCGHDIFQLSFCSEEKTTKSCGEIQRETKDRGTDRDQGWPFEMHNSLTESWRESPSPLSPVVWFQYYREFENVLRSFDGNAFLFIEGTVIVHFLTIPCDWWWCPSFAGEEDHDFISLGSRVGAEMAEEPNLRAKVSVAMRPGDAGDWTGLGIWTPFLSSLANLIFLTDAVCFEGQNSHAHKWAPCRSVISTCFPCGVGNVTALERFFQRVFVSLFWPAERTLR